MDAQGSLLDTHWMILEGNVSCLVLPAGRRNMSNSDIAITTLYFFAVGGTPQT